MDEEILTADDAPEQTSEDAFLSGWDDAPAAQEPADQPEERQTDATADPASAETQPAAEPETTAPPEEAGTSAAEPPQEATGPKVWTLRHMDDETVATEEQMVTLAQKGMDYDRIRSRYDEAKPVMELFSQFAKQSGMSVADYASHLRTQAKLAAGMSEAEASRVVELENREALVAVKEAETTAKETAAGAAESEQKQAEARRSADIAEFRTTFPEAAKDPKSIPETVWAEVRSGRTLVAAYSKWAVAQAQQARQDAEQRAAAAAQNRTNADRSTGSMRSAGEQTGPKDPFLEGWDS